MYNNRKIIQRTMTRTQKHPAEVKAGGTSATAGKSSSNNKNATGEKAALPAKRKTKDYSYRSSWKHKLSRARNLAKRGGMTKQEMKAKHGRFPKKNEWWGPEENEKEWLAKWMLENPKY